MYTYKEIMECVGKKIIPMEILNLLQEILKNEIEKDKENKPDILWIMMICYLFGTMTKNNK